MSIACQRDEDFDIRRRYAGSQLELFLGRPGLSVGKERLRLPPQPGPPATLLPGGPLLCALGPGPLPHASPVQDRGHPLLCTHNNRTPAGAELPRDRGSKVHKSCTADPWR
jgi:hypothetical protein